MSGTALLAVDAAQLLLRAHAQPLLPRLESWAGAGGMVLAKPLLAAIDQPLGDVSAMDGVALHSADLASSMSLELAGTIMAGDRPPGPLAPGSAVRIMTGALLPERADAVQRLEKLSWEAPNRVRLLQPVDPGEHVRRAASEQRQGGVLLPSGVRLQPQHVGLLASAAGRGMVEVHPRPRLSVAATGDELVPPDGQEPLPWQVPNSNSSMVAALATHSGALATDLGIVADHEEAIRGTLKAAVTAADVLVFTGGVSRGERDLVQDVLPAVGFEVVFHGVAVKPGKPILFAASPRVLAFGLPGNPLSALVGFLLFVGPLLRLLAGEQAAFPSLLPARLLQPQICDRERDHYRPARLTTVAGMLQAEVLDVASSAHLAALAGADGLILLPRGHTPLAAGDEVRVLPLPGGLGH